MCLGYNWKYATHVSVRLQIKDTATIQEKVNTIWSVRLAWRSVPYCHYYINRKGTCHRKIHFNGIIAVTQGNQKKNQSAALEVELSTWEKRCVSMQNYHGFRYHTIPNYISSFFQFISRIGLASRNETIKPFSLKEPWKANSNCMKLQLSDHILSSIGKARHTITCIG